MAGARIMAHAHTKPLVLPSAAVSSRTAGTPACETAAKRKAGMKSARAAAAARMARWSLRAVEGGGTMRGCLQTLLAKARLV